MKTQAEQDRQACIDNQDAKRAISAACNAEIQAQRAKQQAIKDTQPTKAK